MSRDEEEEVFVCDRCGKRDVAGITFYAKYHVSGFVSICCTCTNPEKTYRESLDDYLSYLGKLQPTYWNVLFHMRTFCDWLDQGKPPAPSDAKEKTK